MAAQLEGPIICKPVGENILSDVPGFPPAVSTHLAEIYGIRTLIELELTVRETSATAAKDGLGGQLREAFGVLGIGGMNLDQAVWSLIRFLQPVWVRPDKPKRTRKPKANPESTPDSSPARASESAPDPAPHRPWDVPIVTALKGPVWRQAVKIGRGCGASDGWLVITVKRIWGDLYPMTLSDEVMLETVRRIYSIPHEVSDGKDGTGKDGTSEPVPVQGLRENDTDNQPEQRDDAVRDQVSTLQGSERVVEHVSDGGCGSDHSDTRILPAKQGRVRRSRSRDSGVHSGRSNAVETASGSKTDSGDGTTLQRLCDSNGVHREDVRPTATLVDPLDFDENTPPRRTPPRTQGDPISGYVTIKPYESIVGVYLEWDQAGRIPANSILVQGSYHRSGFGPSRFEGWRLVALPQLNRSTDLPPFGQIVPTALVDTYEPRVVMNVKGDRSSFTVMSPKA